MRIKNLALVEDLTLEMQTGFNVITGETGAGKSIIMGALNLVLGERADRTLIRTGCDSCTVEAVFDVAKLRAPLKTFLDDNGLEPCSDHQLILKRTFSTAGSNRQFVNGSPTALSTLGELGAWLVDMHGPHDHQSLLYSARQLAILDAFGKLESQREAFGEQVRCYQTLEAEKAVLIVDEKTYAQQLDLLRFQTHEIQSARLNPQAEEELELEYQRSSNAARLMELSQGALDLMGESENALLTQMGALGRQLHELQRLDASAGNLATQHEQGLATLNDLQADLRHYADRLEIDPARLQEMEERLNLIHSLKRKYGSSLADVIAFGEESARKLKNLEQRDAELERINAEMSQVQGELKRVGADLTARRRKAIPQLSKAVSKQLTELGFKQSRFEIELQTHGDPTGNLGTLALSGLDKIEFQFAPNPGEPALPLRSIASSGEMARVMLALKTVLAVEDEVPVLVFDEVDANVGGETANAVGDKMRQIARQRQVLCITHLPAVAAAAAAHYVVDKQVKGGRTISQITLLEADTRVEEIARMLGGGKAALQHAAALLMKV